MPRLLEAIPDSAYFFSFLSGALISLAGNLATAALVWTKDLPVSRATLCWLALFVAVAAIGCFWISAALENARRTWEAKGAVADLRAEYIRRHGLRGIKFGLILLAAGLGSAIVAFLLFLIGSAS
jgi:hypothetical protein